MVQSRKFHCLVSSLGNLTTDILDLYHFLLNSFYIPISAFLSLPFFISILCQVLCFYDNFLLLIQSMFLKWFSFSFYFFLILQQFHFTSSFDHLFLGFCVSALWYLFLALTALLSFSYQQHIQLLTYLPTKLPAYQFTLKYRLQFLFPSWQLFFFLMHFHYVQQNYTFLPFS